MRVLITGGAGFIGGHAVRACLEAGWAVEVLDDMSRRGAERTAADLERHAAETGADLAVVRGDVCDRAAVAAFFARPAPERPAAVLHLAGQPAVTASLQDPVRDFRVNALGTLHVLDCVRREGDGTARVVFASTNKVYGDLADVVRESDDGWTLEAPVTEDRPVAPVTPYGVSKAAAEACVTDHRACLDLDAVSLRLSCVYGTRQWGVADQGWVAWFVIAGVLGLPVTVCGDGGQQRDVLWADDLAPLLVRLLAGEGEAPVYNVGGGPGRTLRLNELLDLLDGEDAAPPEVRREDWRPADQRAYVSDIGRITGELDWRPETDVRDGVRRLVAWARERADVLRDVLEVS